MNTQQQQISFDIPNNFAEKFGNETYSFFRELLTPNNTQDITGTIKALLDERELEESKLLYELANYIRTDFVESGIEKITEIPTAYIDIVCEAIYSCDCYEIAKEVFNQYKSFYGIETKKELIDSI